MLTRRYRRKEQTVGRVVHFEVTADDVERAADFYAKALGWRSEGSPFAEGYKMAATGEGSGINGAIMERKLQAQPTIVWVEVDDVNAAIESVRNAGGSTVNEKSTIPGQGQVIYVRDTEGNVLGLKQPL
jgi:predicted enzyme related to lactoylglutathione lyase